MSDSRRAASIVPSQAKENIMRMIALAAALFGRRDIRGKTVGVILSGGNVEPEVFARAIGAGG